jgi:D-3-phosphoglycerate dehydrogenase
MLDKTVLVNKPIHLAALEKLQANVHTLTPYTLPADGVRALLPEVQGVILGGRLFLGGAEMDLAPGLEVIGRHGVGLDTVDLEAATARGIPVVYTPYGPTESTAEHALLLMLAVARRLPQIDRAVRTGDFAVRERNEAMGHELEGKTLGVVGFGRIGRRLAEMCHQALHMPVYVFDPHLEAGPAEAWGAVRVADLKDLAANVDVLSVHTPLTPETYHLIDNEVLRALRPGAILVNTSRGPVVDEVALIAALQDGHLGGAGLDVYDPQPPAADNSLLAMDQVVLTPHVASFTDEARKRMGLTVVADVLAVLHGQQPQHLANPEVANMPNSRNQAL